MKRGLVVGKFYPPHKGHSYLIETARALVDELIVMVIYRPEQAIPGQLRADWIKEMHPGVTVMLVPDIGKDDDSQAWADYTIEVLGYAPDVVITSENYGTTWSQCLGCEHILVDLDRTHIPISATKVRSNPYRYWEFLDPTVQAYFVKRICVLGAESTGTTTLAKALAQHYQTSCALEYGRYYTESKAYGEGPDKWATEELVHIASMQNQWEDELARHANRLLICDTDSFATCLWQERLIGKRSPEVEAATLGRKYDLYILTSPDIPFEQDGTRQGGPARLAMHRQFQKALKQTGKNFITVAGPHEDRLTKAITACDALLSAQTNLQLSSQDLVARLN